MPTTTQTDTNNEFDWSTIETITNPDGSLFRIQTVFDSGLVRTEYYTNDVVTNLQEDDTNSNLHPWATKSWTYDGSGALTNTGTTFDDGTSRYETYVEGVLSTVIQNDWGAVNNHSWDRIQSFYDANGELERRTTSYDDTSSKIEFFDAGKLTVLQQFDTDDDAAPWETIQRDYDPMTGEMTRKATTYDDGVRRIEEFENGERVYHQLRDVDNQKSFDTIDYYENPTDGSLTKFTEFDNGSTREEVFNGGMRVRTIEQDLQDGNDGNSTWDRIETYYDQNGELEARLTDYDSGAMRTQYFDNGQRTRTVDTDIDDGNGGTATWSEIETFYNLNGNLEAKLTTFDNGSTREELYNDGMRTRTTSVDASGPESAYSWDRIETFYDAAGKVEAKLTTNDDGSTREEIFSDGLRVRTTQTDSDEFGGSYAWSQIETFYDSAGWIEARLMTYDDGRTREDTYDFGNVAQSIETDNSPDGAAWDWSSISTYYEDGQRLARTTEYDNGALRTEEYTEGVRSRTIEEDGSVDGSARSFVTKTTDFDALGRIAHRNTTLDDGVQRVEEFNSGIRSRTIETDVENNNSWTSRTTEFDGNGQIIQRDQLGDDGVQRADIYLNGARTERIVNDNDNNYDWQGRVTKFDANNQRQETRTIFDNTDELLELYVDGQRTAKIEVDGDGSDSWGVRLSEYDTDGVLLLTEEYDDASDLPAQYASFFDTGDGGGGGGGGGGPGGGDIPIGVG